MRSDVEGFITHAINSLGNTEVYSLHDIEWRNVCISMKDFFEKGKVRPGTNFDGVVLAVHKGLVDDQGYFLIETHHFDGARGITKVLTEAGLEHVFVFETFLRSLIVRDRIDTVLRSSKDEDAFFERGYKRSMQPKTRWIAFKSETDAIAGQAVMDLFDDDDDDFARAS